MRVLIVAGVATTAVLSGCGGAAKSANGTNKTNSTTAAAPAGSKNTTVDAVVKTPTAGNGTGNGTGQNVVLASESVMLPALVGFAAGASVVGLGAAVMRRKAAPLEEPLVA